MTTSGSELFDGSARLEEDVQERVAAATARIDRLGETLAGSGATGGADRFREAILAVLCEDLPKPLTALVGYAHLLKTGRLSPERAMRAVEAIERNATAVNRLVTALIDACRRDCGHQAGSPSGQQVESA